MKVYEEYQYGGYRECLKTAPLRYSGGNLGGGYREYRGRRYGISH